MKAPFVFHDSVGPRPEEPGVGPAPIPGYGVLGLVPVAVAVRGGEDRHSCKLLPRQPVEAGPHPLRFQPGFLGVVHVPEVAAAAELGNGALPVHPVGGFFQDPDDFPCRPGLSCFFDAHQYPLPGNGAERTGSQCRKYCTVVNKEYSFLQEILARMAFICYNQNIQRGLELKGCALLLADRLGMQPKATYGSLSFAVPRKQEVRILSA